MVMSKNAYVLPLRKSDIIEAISDPSVHKGSSINAIDFLVPEGAEVFAVADGIVNRVKVNSSEGGQDEKYKDVTYANFNTINHDHGEQSRYGHLRHKGSFVKEGNVVKAGQVIGISRNTGDTTEPHLHLEINIELDNKCGWEIVGPNFIEPVEM
jgi:murein DD-endopeptidase MepM/ murein hydrolase activator NlpD